MRSEVDMDGGAAYQRQEPTLQSKAEMSVDSKSSKNEQRWSARRARSGSQGSVTAKLFLVVIEYIKDRSCEVLNLQLKM
jgi:hypothetical protein